ncbi:NUT family member 2D [Orycteropus afer afer]|uniref:NUT family member 2D n=1 Tax=Orycteropus afer afer TaxID=1230840 RepID=A0A8B7B1T0_ORYAF|nr:NUT family member 2D [Orycteropus afer afer]
MIMNSRASTSSFTALPFPLASPGPPHQIPLGQHPLPIITALCPPGIPLGLSSFPKTLLMTRVEDCGGAGTGKVIMQVSTKGRSAELPGTQTSVMPLAPLNWSAAGIPSGAVEHAPQLFGAVSTVEQMIPATPIVGTQACRGGWSPPQAAQLDYIFTQVKEQSGPHRSSGEEGQATIQSRPSLDDSSCNPKSVYENYRRWQRFKSLARRYHPQSPDTEALSCFLIPVLRSLARMKPSMTLEEGLWWSVQEWQHKSNFDRMIFYEMAGKFMEFELEEEMQIQKLQQGNGSPCVPPPASQNLDRHELSGTVVTCHPVLTLKKGDVKPQLSNQQPHRPQCPQRLKAHRQIPPEAVNEYLDIMERLQGPTHSITEEQDGKWEEEENKQQQEENALYPDSGLLGYIEKLCSQEAFVTKVEAVIHPQFLETLLSPEPQVDLLSLTQELEQEEGLPLTQLVEKRVVELKGKEGVEALPSYDVPQLEPISKASETSQDSGSRDNHGLQLEISKEMGTKKLTAHGLPKDGTGDSNLYKSKELGLFTCSQKSHKVKSAQLTSPHQGHSRTSPRLRTRYDLMFIETSPVHETPGKRDVSNEEEDTEEELPNLAFLLASQQSLLPWGFPKSPPHASGIVHHGVQGCWQASQYLSPETVCLSQPAYTTTESKMPTQVGAPSSAKKRPYSRTAPGVSQKLPLAVDGVQPKKRHFSH